MALQPNQLDDFVANTLPFFHKNRWKDISLDQQDYIFAARTFESGKIPVRGGQYLQEQIQVRNTGTFEYTGLYGVADAKVVDLIKTSTMDWSMNRVHWIYDIYENDFQSGPAGSMPVGSKETNQKLDKQNELLETLINVTRGNPNALAVALGEA